MINKDEVAKIAKLSRLEASDAFLEKSASDLSGIIDFMHQLDQIDTTNIEPLFSVTDSKGELREDKVISSDLSDKILNASAQGKKDNHFITKIIN